MAERIKTRCPACETRLKLRMPPGTRRGQFVFTCDHCDAHFMIDIPDSKSSELDVIAISGPGVLVDEKDGRRAPGLGSKKKSTVKVERRSKVEVIADTKVKQYRRLTIVMVLLLLTGGLGILYSIVNISNSFAIKDIEEQQSGDLASITIWALDSSNGRGLEGVNVTVISDDRTLSGLTDSEGLVVIEGLNAGRKTLALSLEGYRSNSGDVHIRIGTPNVIDIPMTQGDPSIIDPLATEQFGSSSPPFLLTDFMAILMMLSAFMAILSAYFVYRREFFSLALGLAFLSSFSVGFVVGSIFSVISIFLLITSYKGFSHTYELKWILERAGREDLKRFFSQNKEEHKLQGLPPVRGR